MNLLEEYYEERARGYNHANAVLNVTVYTEVPELSRVKLMRQLNTLRTRKLLKSLYGAEEMQKMMDLIHNYDKEL